MTRPDIEAIRARHEALTAVPNMSGQSHRDRSDLLAYVAELEEALREAKMTAERALRDWQSLRDQRAAEPEWQYGLADEILADNIDQADCAIERVRALLPEDTS